jgi:hypothetical protein
MLLKALYIVMVAAVLVVMPSCSTDNSSDPPTAAFTKAKYLTDLIYITKDKGLVRRYRDAYISGRTDREEFVVLNEWSYDRKREDILETIELHLNSEFVGL